MTQDTLTTGAGYASPIPVRRTHLGDALASEWTKIRSVRSTMWTLGLMLALVIGIGALAAASRSGSMYVSDPLSGGFAGLVLGQVCVITLGVLVVTSEYSTGMVRTTFTACPQRVRVLAAKGVVFFALAFTLTAVAATIAAALNYAALSDKPGTTVYDPVEGPGFIDGPDPVSVEDWLGATVGAALYVALLGLLAVGVGALLRHTAGAVTTMLGVILLPLVIGVFLQASGERDLANSLIEYSPLNGLAALFLIPLEGSPESGGWKLLGLLALVTAAVLAGAALSLSRRDV
ncbi:ABC transporter permease [Streptomyces sp. NPDC051940]|uniref:ABC transporter permease n=1 Tax=Streptomyces sp. NPDC051940 TaxID=3155675 RepID=UPI00341EF589